MAGRARERGPRGRPLPHLRTWRLRRALTQAQLCATAGVGHSTLDRLEREGSPAEATTIAKLAKALDIAPMELMSLDEPDEPIRRFAVGHAG